MAEPIDEYFTATLLAGDGRRRAHPPRRPRAGDGGLQPHRRTGRWIVRFPTRQPPPRPRRATRSAPTARATTRSDRRATKATPPSPPHYAPPIPRCCTTVPVGSSSNAHARSVAVIRCVTSCSGSSPPPRNPSPAGATKCSADKTSTSSPRRRRSPLTCRARWALRSPRQRPQNRRAPARGPPTRSRCAASATPRPITPPRSVRSTPPSTPAIREWRCRCCSSARTTASASAQRHPTGWIATKYANTAGLAYFTADGSDLAATYATAFAAAEWVRHHYRPAFLHIRTVRLMGHAGSDLRTGLPHPTRHHRRLRPRSRPGHRSTAHRAGTPQRRRSDRPLREQTRHRDGSGQRSRRTPTTEFGSRGHRTADHRTA